MNKRYVCFVLGEPTDPQGFACVGGGLIASFEVWGGRFADHETESQRQKRYRALEQLDYWFNYGEGPLPIGWRRASSEEDSLIRSCLFYTIKPVRSGPGFLKANQVQQHSSRVSK